MNEYKVDLVGVPFDPHFNKMWTGKTYKDAVMKAHGAMMEQYPSFVPRGAIVTKGDRWRSFMFSNNVYHPHNPLTGGKGIYKTEKVTGHTHRRDTVNTLTVRHGALSLDLVVEHHFEKRYRRKEKLTNRFVIYFQDDSRLDGNVVIELQDGENDNLTNGRFGRFENEQFDNVIKIIEPDSNDFIDLFDYINTELHGRWSFFPIRIERDDYTTPHATIYTFENQSDAMRFKLHQK